MRLSLLQLGFVFCSMFTATTLLAEGFNIGFVETAQILSKAAPAAAANDRIKREFARRQNELRIESEQLKKLQSKLAKDGQIMSETEVKRLERDIITRSRKLKNSEGELREDLALRQNEELGKLRKIIAEVITQVAKDRNFDLVLEAGVVYASDRANITDIVIQRLNGR